MLYKLVTIHGLSYKVIVIPRQLTHIIVVEFHSAKGHQGMMHTFKAIQRKYWWLKLCQNIVIFITDCPLCTKHHLDMTMYAHLHLEIAKIPIAILAMDTIGRLPATLKGHHDALTAIWLHMSFIFAIPLKEKSAHHIVYAYLTGILAKVGEGCAILLDNGTEFCNKSFIAACGQLGIKWIYSNTFHPEVSSCVENCHNLLKRTVTKFLELSWLEWDDLLLLACYCHNIMPCCTRTESPFFLMFGHDPEEGWLQHLKNKLWYYGDELRHLMLVELHRLWMHHTQLLKDTRQCRDVPVDHIGDAAEPTFKPGQPVMVKHHARHTFEAKYLSDYRVLHQVNECTLLLLLTTDGKEWKTNIGDAKPCTMAALIESAWDSFILSVHNKATKILYNLRPRM